MTVYNPAEDSYLLKDAISRLDLEGKKALDMGTGSGIIAVEMAKQDAEVTAVDVNPEALNEAERRAREEGVEVETVESDLFDDVDGKFDIISFNPPYLPGEEGIGDEEIWRGGEKGTELTRKFLEEVDSYLRRNGAAYLVISNRADHRSLIDEFGLEIVEEEGLWFETLFVARYK